MLMRVAVVGSRTLTLTNLEAYLPPSVTEIVSGGARGIDQFAKAWAHAHGVAYREFLPDYPRYGRSAPIRRNDTIIAAADFVLIFWDGQSRGTAYVIRQCEEKGVPHQVCRLSP